MEPVSEPQAAIADLPKKVTAAGMLFRDANDRILLVEPTYKPRWEIPGGVVERHEPPMSAAMREVLEELSLTIEPMGLLVVDWSPPREGRPRDVQIFVFDGGILSAEQIGSIKLQQSEILSFRFVSLADAEELLAPILYRRVVSCTKAWASRSTLYLEDGEAMF